MKLHEQSDPTLIYQIIYYAPVNQLVIRISLSIPPTAHRAHIIFTAPPQNFSRAKKREAEGAAVHAHILHARESREREYLPKDDSILLSSVPCACIYTSARARVELKDAICPKLALFLLSSLGLPLYNIYYAMRVNKSLRKKNEERELRPIAPNGAEQ